MRFGLYAVIDTVADLLIGGVQLHRHEAAAIRQFTDVASMPNSIVASHPEDFALCRLGYLTAEHNVEPDFAVVLTGSTWAASQLPPSNHANPAS